MTNYTQAMQSNEAVEKSVLSTMMHHPNLYKQALADGIDAECFWHPTNQIIFEAIKDRPRDENGEIDLATFVPHLNDMGLLDRAGGPSAIMDVFTRNVTGSGWTLWLAELKEMKGRRIGVVGSRSLSEAVDSAEAIETAKNIIEALTGAVESKSRAQNAKQAVGMFLEIFQADHAAGSLVGMSTGLPELDEISGGLKGGQLWVVGAKPSRGKSVLMCQFTVEAILQGKVVIIFSLEMTTHEVVSRLICCMARVDYGVLTTPKSASKSDLQKIQRAYEILSKSRLYIDSSANQTMASIEAECQRIEDLNDGQIGFIAIDYLQIIKSPTKSSKSREEEVAHSSGSCKQLAKHHNCPVMTATQLNEQNQTRESRAIEQDADSLLFICDDGIKIGKMRNGKRDTVMRLLLNGARQRFE
jgi:replicative DNA helicase